MKVSLGKMVYSLGNPPCTGVGFKWSTNDLNKALEGKVSSILFDDEGAENIQQMMGTAELAHFEQAALNRIRTIPKSIEDWRVAQAIAIAWLTDHRQCLFPWNDSRDQRKRGSSLPGADLVGLITDSLGERFAFGEIKSSSDTNRPPTVMYGQSGLLKQIQDIRDLPSVRDDLFKYLGHRARNASWIHRFQEAGKRYLANKSDVQLFGFLVRDVAPNDSDLKVQVSHLGEKCPEETHIEMVALYLPPSHLKGIGLVIVNTQSEGGP